jgi:hypothetical protein
MLRCAQRGAPLQLRGCALRCAVVSLLVRAARSQIVAASKGAGSGVCFVGPYGWTCDPSDFDRAAVAVQALASGAATSAVGASQAARLANAPACADDCTDDCTPPCPPACAEAKFQARRWLRHAAAAAAYRLPDCGLPPSRSNGWRSSRPARCSSS